MNDPLCIELFGGLRVEQGTRLITRFRTQKTASLLAYLAYHLPRPLQAKEGRRGGLAHPREVLAELLWPEHTPRSGRLSLNTALHSLRKQLEPPGVPAGGVIIADRFSVQLNPDAVTVDVAEFEAALHSEQRTMSDDERTHHLITAVELYQGELLPGFYDEWIEQERTRLEETYLRALDRLVKLLAQARDFDRALNYARRAVAADPLREESHQTLMRLYADAGQPDAAMEQYRELKRLLKEFLNTAPAAATRALAREISERERERSALAVSSEQLIVVSGGRSVGSQQLTEGKRQKAGEGQATTSSQPPASHRPSPAPILQFPLTTHHSPRRTLASATTHQTGSLPLQFTRFFGREDEIGQLREMLLADETRLVTLTGAGGSGKTRLAIEVGARLREEFQGGVWFVPLADLSDPRLMAGAARDALRLPRSPSIDPLEQVVDALSRQPSLLILDNLEHLMVHGQWFMVNEVNDPQPLTIHFILTLLQRVPTLTCLVTSRQRLDGGGEREFSVSPLPTPQGAGKGHPSSLISDASVRPHPSSLPPESLMTFPSVQLFVDRAQAVRPDFQVTKRNAARVAALCEKLEGIPLAIELVAAWAQTLTVSQMLSRLSRRFELLVSRRKDLPERHRSLRAAMEWSYRLLPPELRRFFAQLSVFRGGWTLEAAEAVCADGTWSMVNGQWSMESSTINHQPSTIDHLRDLRERSLMIAEEVGSEMRYRLLETLREFGVEQLTPEERSALSQRHARYFLSLAEEARVPLESPQQGTWLERLEAEHDNLRVALQWCVDSGDAESGLGMGGGLWRFWNVHGHLSEGREWLQRLLAMPGAEARTIARAHVLNGAGNLAYAQGDYAAARAFLEECLAIRQESGDVESVAGALNNLANAVTTQGDFAAAWSLYERALTIHRTMGNQAKEAVVLNNLGRVAHMQGDYAAAWSLYEQALVIDRELGNRAWEAYDLAGLGIVAWHQSDYATARALCEESLALFREIGNKSGMAQSLYSLGVAACRQGDTASARSLLGESLTTNREIGNRGGVANVLGAMAELAQVEGDVERAARLWGAAESLREAIGAPLPPCDRPDYERNVAAARAASGEKTFAAAWTQGRLLTWQQAAAYALGETT